MTEREERLQELIAESHAILDEAVDRLVAADDRELAATIILYSGGNDSTVLAHLFRERADYAAHVNTGIGIERTREFVRQTCADWELPLVEESPPPGSTYRELVLDQGFPGPGHHWKMYQRLKERALRKVRKRFVQNGRRQRVVFLAGRRLDESQRRTSRNIPAYEREGSVVWVSPLINWTKLDLNTYRMVNPDCPQNEVSALIHMSGECLCGAFAKPGEIDEIGFWFPEVRKNIEALEEEVRAAGHPEQKCKWGWGAYKDGVRPSKNGPLCSSCTFNPAKDEEGCLTPQN